MPCGTADDSLPVVRVRSSWRSIPAIGKSRGGWFRLRGQQVQKDWRFLRGLALLAGAHLRSHQVDIVDLLRYNADRSVVRNTDLLTRTAYVDLHPIWMDGIP
jgi:hypothetical protein